LNNVVDSVGNGSSQISVTMALLFADTNGDGAVNATDVIQTKSRIGQGPTNANFHSDVNANGLSTHPMPQS
jgi:hypothetical protein